MKTKDTIINDSNYKKLLHNEDYYRYIFKKTEKIISVVFYILNNTDTDKRLETHISNIAGKAHFAHENALRTLEVKPANSKEVLEQFAQALIALDSTLRVAAGSGIISQEVLYVVTSEIDTVLRSLSKYISSDTNVSTLLHTTSSTRTSMADTQGNKPSSTAVKTTHKTAAKVDPSPDRRTRIRTIIEAKGEATIKDISEIITDCSEKTIQREINAMIADGQIQRHGERRWSKYTLV